MRQDRKREQFSKARLPGAALTEKTSSVRHSKVAEAAVAAFTTAAARAAQVKRSNQVVPEQMEKNHKSYPLQRITCG